MLELQEGGEAGGRSGPAGQHAWKMGHLLVVFNAASASPRGGVSDDCSENLVHPHLSTAP